MSFTVFIAGPLVELTLGNSQRLFQALDTYALGEGVVLGIRQQIKLVAKVAKVGIDGRCGKHQHLCFAALGDDVFDQTRIAALSNDVAVLVLSVGRVVPEVVRFIDHDEVEIFPVKIPQIDTA